MSGRGITDLCAPPILFRIDRHCAGFETSTMSANEDLIRAKQLIRTATRYPDEVDPEAALALADALGGRKGQTLSSLASSTYLRRLRIKVCGQIWKLVTEIKSHKAQTFTIIPATGERSANHLMELNASDMTNAVRSALYSKGAGQSDGWLIAFLHSEHDPNADVYRFHFHGICYGGMTQVVDRLRTLPNYRSCRFQHDGSPSPVYRRLRLSRKPLDRLPAPITYLLQSFWPARALLISEDGTRLRARRKGRIKEPRHTQALLWLDKQRLEDLTLMIGLRVTKAGLKQTKPVS
jgi:hypothetical protein